MKKQKIALILNIILVILEVIGFSYELIKNHSIAFEYYTNLSNLFVLITSLLFIITYKKEKEIIKDLRLAATSCLMITFLVVIFILTPMYDFNYKLLMFTGSFFIYHTACPIISIISYILFEEGSKKKYLGFVVTAIYSIIMIILNIVGIISGPYPFLKVTEQSIVMSIIWAIIIVGGSYFIGLLLYLLNKKGKEANF